MGHLYLDGVQVGDDGRTSGRTFGPDPEAEARRERCRAAMERALEEVGGAGRRARLYLVKRAARRYRDGPWHLDTIKLGLSDAHPAFILAAVEQKARIPWGRIDMLGVVPTNLAGAALYARWLRRQMRPAPALRIVTKERADA